MRFMSVVAAGLLATSTAARAQDESRVIADGGIKVAGWQGKIDANEARRGAKLDNSKLERAGSTLRVTTGPAVAYWNPSNVATGSYTVKATFTEEKYMSLNNHPHPYGLFIAGSNMGTDDQSYLYCMAYGDGRFIVRGFSGDTTFRLNGRGEAHPAINKASGVGASVTQEIALSVNGDKIECAINGQTVGSYDKSMVVGEKKLTSTDGVYGIRFGHNTDAVVSGLTLTTTRSGNAQDDEDVRQIRDVIGVYFRGHATGSPDTMRAAFLPTARIEGIRNGAFSSWTVDQYVGNFRGTPAADEASRMRVIDEIDKSGTAAMVKATLKHGAVTFTDYFVLLKSNGKWLIANKVYHAQRPDSPAR